MVQKNFFHLNLYTLSNNDEFAKTYDEFLLNNSDGSNHVMFKVRFFGNEFVLVHTIAVRIYRIKCPDGMVQDSVLPSLIISFQSSEIFFCDYRSKKSGITKHSNPDIFFQIQHRTDNQTEKNF